MMNKCQYQEISDDLERKLIILFAQDWFYHYDSSADSEQFSKGWQEVVCGMQDTRMI